MPSAYTPGIEIAKAAVVRRERRLPVKGEVLVSEGERVEPDTVVARAFLPGELVTVRVAEELGVPAGEAGERLTVKEGDEVSAGQVVARASFLWGLFRSEAKSPVTGTVEFWSPLTGNLGVRLPSRPIQVDAFIAGEVEEILPEEGALIRCTAALVQGVIGVGPEARGPVRILGNAGELDDSFKGAIAVWPGRADLEMLRRGTEAGISGMVAASVSDSDLSEFLGRSLSVAVTGDENLPFPLVITEGFGRLRMSERALRTIEGVEGRTGSLSARTQIRAGAVRPELIVPVEGGAEPEDSPPSFTLERGTRVRLIREPNFGRTGTVASVPREPSRLETGAVVPVVEVDLDEGGKAVVPRANVEVLL